MRAGGRQGESGNSSAKAVRQPAPRVAQGARNPKLGSVLTPPPAEPEACAFSPDKGGFANAWRL